MEGVSTITVQFLLSKDGDVGTQEVRDKVNTILADLPDGTEPPIIDKFDTGLDARDDDRRLGPARLPRGDRAGAEADQGAARNGQRRRRGHPGRRPGPRDERRGRHRATGRATTSRSRTSASPWCGRTSRCPAAGSTRGRASWSCAPSAGSAPRPSSTTLIVANRNGYPIRHPRHRPRRGLVRGAARPSPGSTASTPSAWWSRSSRG